MGSGMYGQERSWHYVRVDYFTPRAWNDELLHNHVCNSFAILATLKFLIDIDIDINQVANFVTLS